MRQNVECRQRPPSVVAGLKGWLDASGPGVKRYPANFTIFEMLQFLRLGHRIVLVCKD